MIMRRIWCGFIGRVLSSVWLGVRGRGRTGGVEVEPRSHEIKRYTYVTTSRLVVISITDLKSIESA
jgi:hypothetical protein